MDQNAAAGRLKDCTVLLIRHAHIGLAGRFCGRTDPPLSELGREQAAKLAEELAEHPLTHIFSSDLLRTRETAAFIAVKSGLKVELLSQLRELYFGEWEGLSWDEVSGTHPDYAQRWMEKYPLLPAPGGEDFAAFRDRVQGALAEVAARSEGGCAAVVTHSGVIRTFMLHVLNLPLSALAGVECGYASCIKIRIHAGRWSRES